jgi:hypothetical protein
MKHKVLKTIRIVLGARAQQWSLIFQIDLSQEVANEKAIRFL